MANNYIQDGKYLEFPAPTGGVVSGMIYLIGSIYVVAMGSAAEGETFTAATCGVYELPKAVADVCAAGDAAYMTPDGSAVSVEESGGIIGLFTEARGNGTTSAYVRLNGIAG